MQFISAIIAIKALSDFDKAAKSFKHILSGKVANFDCKLWQARSVRHFFRIHRAWKPFPSLSAAPQLHYEASSCGFSPQLEQTANYFRSCAVDPSVRPRNEGS